MQGGNMAQGKFVAYYRVSTARQGASGLGLEAQQASVAAYLNGGSWELVGQFTEIESGGKSDLERPELRAAQAACKRLGATLIVAKLDRLSRDVRILLALVDDGVPIRFVDLPDIPGGAVGRLILTQMAAVAEFERRRISERTKDALKAAKARGVKLGTAGRANLRLVNDQRNADAKAYANTVGSVLLGLQGQGMKQRQMVDKLNELKLPTPRGGQWHLKTLQRVLARLAPEQRVCRLVADLKREGFTVQAIVAELQQRGVFDDAGRPYAADAVATMLKAA
jgi:DNA invertase Pin-like site-specific DNA recombinase